VDFSLRDQLLIRYSAFIRCWRKKWEYDGTLFHLFIVLKKARDSVKGQVFYKIFIEFGILMKLVRL